MEIVTTGIADLDRFAARKSAEADAASISPMITDSDPQLLARADGSDAADRWLSLTAIGNDWSRRVFDGDFYLSAQRDDGLPSTSLVFVRSREGNTVAADPASLGGGDVDKHLIYEGLSRVAADAVLGGAGTIRDGRLVLSIWRRELVELRASLQLPRHPAQVVATLGGLPLEQGLLFNVPSLPVFVITTHRGVDTMRAALTPRPWITPIVMASPHDLPLAFRELRARGVRRLSCIGGRTLAAQLVEAGLVQDLYLTTTPRSAGEPGTPFFAGPLPGRTIVRKRGTGPDEGVVFDHVALSAREPDGTNGTEPTGPSRPA